MISHGEYSNSYILIELNLKKVEPSADFLGDLVPVHVTLCQFCSFTALFVLFFIPVVFLFSLSGCFEIFLFL